MIDDGLFFAGNTAGADRGHRDTLRSAKMGQILSLKTLEVGPGPAMTNTHIS